MKHIALVLALALPACKSSESRVAVVDETPDIVLASAPDKPKAPTLRLEDLPSTPAHVPLDVGVEAGRINSIFAKCLDEMSERDLTLDKDEAANARRLRIGIMVGTLAFILKGQNAADMEAIKGVAEVQIRLLSGKSAATE